MRNLPEDTCV